MNTAQITSNTSGESNNRLVKNSSHGEQEMTDGQLVVALMQALQKAQRQAKANPKEAELNRTTMSDNNRGRIIYNFNIYQTPQIVNMLRLKKTIKKKGIEPNKK